MSIVLLTYLESYLMPKTSLKSEKVAIGTLMFLISRKGGNLISQGILDKLKATGAVDEDNKIDLDFTHEYFNFILEKSGGSFPLSYTIPIVGTQLSYTLDKQDLQTIYDTAKQLVPA